MKTYIALGLVAAVGALVFGLPLPLDYAGRAVVFLALAAAICWTLEPIPLALTALCLLLILPVSGVATFESTFAVFGRPAVWLVFSGMVISQLITETQLGGFLSSAIVGRLRNPAVFIVELVLWGCCWRC